MIPVGMISSVRSILETDPKRCVCRTVKYLLESHIQ